jgi:hypothetical protein
MASGKKGQRTGLLQSAVIRENLKKKFRLNNQLWTEFNQCRFQIYTSKITTISKKLWSPKI